MRRFENGSVRQVAENAWVVRGDPRLGDRYPNYVVRLRDGRYQCSCFETGWGLRRRGEVCTHIAAVILHREYSRLMQPIYAAVISMECEGDYYIEVLDKGVKAIRRVRALSSDLTKPRYRVTYVITSNEPRTVRIRYACGDETGETEVALSKVMRFVIELMKD
ncbi:zinc finger, SWIM domain protein [Vulcanisaeta moutnovskia 768-28]|uniref:Zinc finger, SWIM domain protein n=1 Tax=Vulcanisaeta moutnovskia (strain 768-28) TaxID=985053 RepID=F0QXR3_VULM7|nr:zinc finger, SWIM domain protein [Vulcanisaeta moutnovskia 768-28]